MLNIFVTRRYGYLGGMAILMRQLSCNSFKGLDDGSCVRAKQLTVDEASDVWRHDASATGKVTGKVCEKP
ncbi:MAG: hypothetical protein ACR2PG_04025 [Hyphomicrobiaceae bacterium]